MRFFKSVFLCLFSLSAFCQKEKMATISFNTANVKLAEGMYIEIEKYQNDSGIYKLLKKINIVKPEFSIAMKVDEPIDCRMFLKMNDSILYVSNPFYIANEVIAISFDTKDVMIRSRQNDFYQRNSLLYFALPATIMNEKGFSFQLLKSAYELPILPFNQYLLRLKILEYENNVIDLTKANRSYYRTLTALYNIRGRLTPKTLETCQNILKPYWKNTSFFKQLEEYIIQEKKIFVGEQLPVFTLLDEDLNECQSIGLYSLHDFTLLDFWASWCGPCRAQTKVIQAMYPGIDTGRMQIVSVSIDEDKKKWMQAVRQDSMVWNSYIDRKGGWDGSVAKNFNLTYIPANVIVDKTGKIVAVNVTTEWLKDFMIVNGVMKNGD
jgi:thiol-disulfide isomerase/thioredoxin